LESELPYKHKKLQGKAIWYYPSGNPRLEVEYENGLKEGTLTHFFYNGKTKTIEHYHNDLADGLSVEYDEKGALVSELYYKAGIKEGVVKQYFPDGTLFFSGKYVHDQYDGQWKYFDIEGFTVGTGSFTNGKGELLGYGKDGNLTRKVYYNNSLVTKEELYSQENQQIEKTIYYKEGRIVDEKGNKK
jgi:antitoxin component YwqK of YwqJK toxin-antitoxin module